MRALLLVVAIAACSDSSHATIDAYPENDLGGPPDAAPLLNTTPSQWVWVEIPGTTCANGSPAGIGVNRAPTDGGNLFVYFEGGGACWDTTTCTNGSAVNLDVTYDAAKLASDTAGLAIDRSAPPFNTTTAIFVPYCTGDLHAGTKVMAYPNGPTLHHTGGTNTQAFVDAIAGTFPTAPVVWVLGSSAGGYGATLNFHRFTAAYPGAGVELLEDSSPFIPFLANYDKTVSAWAPAYPPGCTGCDTSFTAIFDTVAAAHPQSRIALMTWDDDPVIKAYFGYTTSVAAAQTDLITNHFDHPNTKVFEASGANHTMFGNLGAVVSHSVNGATWFIQWLTGDPAWATVTP